MTNSKLARLLTLGLTIAISACPTYAQATTEVEVPEEQTAEAPPGFVLPPRMRKVAFRDANPWTFHVNARYNSGKSSVQFGGLGEVPSIQNLPGADRTEVVVRRYDDGGVALDGLRSSEKDADGNQTSTPGGRYTTEKGESLLSYTPGQTRQWFYTHDSQQVDGGIAMHAFSAQSTGATAAADHDGSNLGMEMAVSRRFLKLSPKTEINLTASIGMTDVKAATAGRVMSDLITMTDLYELYGDAPDARYEAPSFGNLFDDIGNIILADGLETTVPLQQVTPNRTFTTTAGGAFVDGDWELKGAYYSIRMGAEIRTHLTEKIGIVASAGLMGAFVGTDYTVTETLDMSAYEVGNPITITQTGEHSEMILGYYAEIAAEYWITPRTALFVGGVFEAIDDYFQTVGGRTASIMLGDNLIVRVGIITRF
ncbi:hypothetical protein [Synoicihabitans lomoniglobus]|uniref:Outer membrane protein beta-barrel domain-containing protein n=1 Tax=Synoicihabitans lomoniglobus TaxID=2909285 RepID=A0AAF0I7W7_9BACT|nr:hypothetical protein [Opitutaceae bacterium LMO-M01]WED67081.1 hypothetical protein PXH66_09480 [Opitutaceae bacterium LMO-M01]